MGKNKKSEEILYLVDNLMERYPKLSIIKNDIIDAFLLIKYCYLSKGKLLIAGNGGSASDADHIVGELMKSFKCSRPLHKSIADQIFEIDSHVAPYIIENLEGALPALALHNHTSLCTAFANDKKPDLCFAQQVIGYAETNDIFLGISTSGNSKNIIYAAIAAKAKGLKVIAFTGKTPGKLAKYADICICTPEKETYKAQELQLPIYHCWCLMLEKYFFAYKEGIF